MFNCSILDNILFTLHLNLICDLNLDGRIVLYADDTCLLFMDKFWDEVHSKESKVTIGIIEVYKCFCDRNLILNND